MNTEFIWGVTPMNRSTSVNSHSVPETGLKENPVPAWKPKQYLRALGGEATIVIKAAKPREPTQG